MLKNTKEYQEHLLFECPNGYKLKNYCHDHNLTLRSFILLFLKLLTKAHITETNNCFVNSIISEKKEERTIEDIFLIARHYYPYCTLNEIHNILTSLPSVKSSFSKENKNTVYKYTNE